MPELRFEFTDPLLQFVAPGCLVDMSIDAHRIRSKPEVPRREISRLLDDVDPLLLESIPRPHQSIKLLLDLRRRSRSRSTCFEPQLVASVEKIYSLAGINRFLEPGPDRRKLLQNPIEIAHDPTKTKVRRRPPQSGTRIRSM